MLYHGFYVKFVPTEKIPHEDNDGEIVFCRGYKIFIFADKEMKNPVEIFYAAEGFEIPSATLENAEQFAKDVIDIEQKKYFADRILTECRN